MNALPISSVASRIAKLASISFLSFAIEKIAQILIIFAIAKALHPQDYGRFILAQGLTASTQLLVVMGMGAIISTTIPTLSHDIPRRTSIINSCFIAALFPLALLALASATFGQGLLSSLFNLNSTKYLSLALFLWVSSSAISSLMSTIAMSLEMGKSLVVSSVIYACIAPIALVAAEQLGVVGAIAALAAADAARALVLLSIYGSKLTRQGERLLQPPTLAIASSIRTTGIPILLKAALWGPSIWAAQLMVKSYSPSGLSEVGKFGFANNIIGAIVIVSTLTNRAALPILASAAAPDFNRLRPMTTLLATIQAVCAVIISAIIAAVLPITIDLFGIPAVNNTLVYITLAAAVSISVQNSYENFFIIIGRSDYIFYTSIMWSIMFLSICWLYIPWTNGSHALATSLLAASFFRAAMLAIGLKIILPSDRTIKTKDHKR